MDHVARGIGRRLPAAVAAVAMVAASTMVWADDATLAWRRDGSIEWRALDGRPAAPPALVPLGSLWKLFLYADLVESESREPPYRCAPGPRRGPDEDDYCCDAGQSVGRDEALARSCGRYFQPARLALEATGWRRRWQGRGPAWLADLGQLRPETAVAPAELLEALEVVSPQARRRAREALLPVLLQGYGRDAWPELGAGLRVKTYSWHDARGQAIGGGAGWLADGTAVWFGGRGASRQVLERHGAAIARALPPPQPADDADGPCVDVRFFARYPIRRVQDAASRDAATGTLGGRVVVEFENGRRLAISPQRRLELSRENGRPAIRGRLALEDYVARVLDREGSGEPVQAARALAVAVRSYLVQNAAFAQGCRAIADDSRSQRVSANPPSAAALAAARFTEGVTVQAPVRYHRDQAAPGRLAWRRAVVLAEGGARFDAILAEAYGPAAFAGIDGETGCRRLADAEAWLTGRANAWGRQLRRHPGFETPGSLSICALGHGHPYSDQGQGRIYVRDWMSAQGRLALAHEYVHLAFRFHPAGGDEAFVERAARMLDAGAQP